MLYAITHMIDPIAIGEVALSLPLHMTLVHWFSYDGDEVKLISTCNAVLESTPIFNCTMDEGNEFVVNSADLVLSSVISKSERKILARFNLIG